jgi:hypothetical protein
LANTSNSATENLREPAALANVQNLNEGSISGSEFEPSLQHQSGLTGLAHLEAVMAYQFAERANGWPVGGEYRGRAWSCATPTVQIVRQPHATGLARYVVLTLFPFCRSDRRHPPSEPLTLHRARRMAWARLWKLAGRDPVQPGRDGGIELARGGSHVGLEVL